MSVSCNTTQNKDLEIELKVDYSKSIPLPLEPYYDISVLGLPNDIPMKNELIECANDSLEEKGFRYNSKWQDAHVKIIVIRSNSFELPKDPVEIYKLTWQDIFREVVYSEGYGSEDTKIGIRFAVTCEKNSEVFWTAYARCNGKLKDIRNHLPKLLKEIITEYPKPAKYSKRKIINTMNK
jgi:hypothetical protein